MNYQRWDLGWVKAGTVVTVDQDRRIGTADGFGFVEQVIIDQHFLKRGRHYRLQSLALRHPELIGVGIDEATAIVVSPDGTFTILGDSQVVVYDPAATAEYESDAAGPRVHVLSAGKRYCMHRQLVLN